MNKEERKAIEYYQDKEISFSVNFDIQISIANTEEGGIIRGNISIDPNTYDIQLKFDNSIDSKSI